MIHLRLKPRPLHKTDFLAIVAIALGALAPFGCKKSPESLVVVSLTAADPTAAMLTSTTLTVSATSETFALTGGLSTSPKTFGVYVPSDVTGAVSVGAVATGGGVCFAGMASPKPTIPSGGSTVNVMVALMPTACGADGGAGSGGRGGGGTTGAGGSAGTTGAGGSAGTTGAGGSAGTGASGSAGTTGAGGSAGGGRGGASGGAGGGGRGGTSGGAGAGGRGGTSGGAGGAAGGSSGASGSAGAGGGVVVSPPSLTQCVDYDHNDVNAAPCNDAMGISNWTIWSLAFSPDGKLLATAGDDGRVKIWSFDGTKLTATGHVLSTSGATFVAFSPDGTSLATGSRTGIVIYNVASWTMRATLGGIVDYIDGVAFSPDSQRVVSIDDHPNLYVHTLATPTTPVVTLLPASASSMALSPVATTTTSWAAIGFTTGRCAIYNLATSPPTVDSAFIVTSDSSYTTGLQFSPNGTVLAGGGEDGYLHFWGIPITNTNPVGTSVLFSMGANPNAVSGLSFSPDGKYLGVAAGSYNSGGSGDIVTVASRAIYGKVVPTYYPVSVAYSPSGRALAIGEVTCGKVSLCVDTN